MIASTSRFCDQKKTKEVLKRCNVTFKSMLIANYVISIIVLYTTTVGCSVNNKYSSYIIRKWDKSTLLSVKNQFVSSNDRLLKREIKNDLKIMETYLGKNSLRSDFFENVVSVDKHLNNFFVIEFVEKGERFRIKNALIVNEKNGCKVTFFEYLNKRWKSIGTTAFDNFKLSEVALNGEIIKNEEDLGLKNLVISKFDDDNVISYYYGDRRLDKNSVLCKILAQAIEK